MIDLDKFARGSWQLGIARDLAQYRQVCNPTKNLRGRAKNYRSRYMASFRSLLSRLENAGYKIEVQYGPRGGLYSAIYRLIIV